MSVSRTSSEGLKLHNNGFPLEDGYMPRPFFSLLAAGLIATVSLLPRLAEAKGSSSHSSDARAKSVHVSSYTKKDGTKVQPYNRRPPR